MKSSTGVERRALFVDSWGWLVLAREEDPAHAAAASIRNECKTPGSVVTTDYVLDETFTLLFKRASFSQALNFGVGVLKSAEIGSLKIERITPDRFQAAWRLRLRYHDKPLISFTDLTSFVIMRELGITDVLTADTHFAKVGLGFKLVP
jgi:predicted nucleic acid-binding protein